MFRKTLSSFIIFGVCSTPFMALGQQNDYHHDNNNNQQNDYRHDNNNQQNDNRHDNNNNYHQNDSRHDNYNDSRHENNFHQNDYHDSHHQQYVHHSEWRHGYHMRHDDWNRGERIDYRTYHLSAPPRGYEWREVDGNYVMAAAATGIIASVIAASAR